MQNESINEGTHGVRNLNPALTQPLNLECNVRPLFLQCLGFRICKVRLSPNKHCPSAYLTGLAVLVGRPERWETHLKLGSGGAGGAPLGDSSVSLQWNKSLGGENLEFQELRDLCLPGICLPRFPGMKMLYTPFFPAIAGSPGRQPRAPADSSGLAHSGRAVGLGLVQGLGLTSFLPASLLLPPRCTGLTASWSQGGSLALGFWTQVVVDRPGQREARGQVFPAAPTAVSPSVSACAHPRMGTLGLSLRSKDATQYPVRRRKAGRP